MLIFFYVYEVGLHDFFCAFKGVDNIFAGGKVDIAVNLDVEVTGTHYVEIGHQGSGFIFIPDDLNIALFLLLYV